MSIHLHFSSRDSLLVFFAGRPGEQVGHGQGCPLFDVVHPAFTLPTTASPTLEVAPKDVFAEAVVACDISATGCIGWYIKVAYLFFGLFC